MVLKRHEILHNFSSLFMMNLPRLRSLKPPIFLCLITATCLAPFLDKGFHIDDPLFLWSAQQIQKDPFNFYGMTINWGGQNEPLSNINLNPLFVSYYLALMASILGWKETALHFSMVLPTLTAILGTFIFGAWINC